MRTIHSKALLASLFSVGVSLVAGCGGSSDPTSSAPAPHAGAVVAKSLSGRYTPTGPATERGVPGALLGIQSIWFSGKGDYQLVVAHCASSCEEQGTYSVDDANLLTLTSFSNVVHKLQLSGISSASAPASARAHLTNTSAGDPSASGADGACGATTDAYEDDSSTTGSDADSDCSAPSGTASGLDASEPEADAGASTPIGDGKSDPGATGLTRTSGSKEPPSSPTKGTTKSGYDASAAVSYAEANWNTNASQECSEFTSRTLIAGHLGVSVLPYAPDLLGALSSYAYDEHAQGSANLSAAPGDVVFFSDESGAKFYDPNTSDEHNCGHVCPVVVGGTTEDSVLLDCHNNAHQHISISGLLGSYTTYRIYHIQ